MCTLFISYTGIVTSLSWQECTSIIYGMQEAKGKVAGSPCFIRSYTADTIHVTSLSAAAIYRLSRFVHIKVNVNRVALILCYIKITKITSTRQVGLDKIS